MQTRNKLLVGPDQAVQVVGGLERLEKTLQVFVVNVAQDVMLDCAEAAAQVKSQDLHATDKPVERLVDCRHRRVLALKLLRKAVRVTFA